MRRILAAKFYLLASHMLDAITEGSIVQAGLKEKSLAAAILADKALPTERYMARQARIMNENERPSGPEPADSERQIER